jgi:hypothetical protein
MTNESLKKYKLPDDVIEVILSKYSDKAAEHTAAHFARLRIRTVEEALAEISRTARMPKRKTVPADRDKLNGKVLELVAMYNGGNNVDYAIGGLETLSEVFGVDLLHKYGINR